MSRQIAGQDGTGVPASGHPGMAKQTLIGARLRWMAGMIKAFVGEATGNAELEVEGTVDKLIGRVKADSLARRQALGAALDEQDAGFAQEPYDIGLHDRAARHLELAAHHHRRAVHWYRAGDHELAHYHAFLAQGFCADAAEITGELGKGLWRTVENE